MQNAWLPAWRQEKHRYWRFAVQESGKLSFPRYLLFAKRVLRRLFQLFLALSGDLTQALDRSFANVQFAVD